MDIFLSEYGFKCTLKGGRLIIREDDSIVKSVPLARLSSLTLMTGAHLSTKVLTWCYQNKVPVLFLTRSGKITCHIFPDCVNRVTLRTNQYRIFADNEWRCRQVRLLLLAKLLQHLIFVREKGLLNKTTHYRRLIKLISRSDSVDRLRGLEGYANRLHFEVIREIMPDWLCFQKRVHRFPKDPMNSLLSFSYTLLYRLTIAMLTLTGLDPWLGFYHDVKIGHMACASDLMEPFRVIIVDRTIVKLIATKQITRKTFARRSGRYQLTKEGYAIVLRALHKRMEERRIYGGKSLTWMEILRKECFALSAAVRTQSFYQPLAAL